MTEGSTIPYDPQTYPQDFEDNQGNIDSGVNDWMGFENNASFSHESGTEHGVVSIYVIKPKEGITESGGYDVKSPGILLDVGCMLLGDLHTSYKDITYNGKPACLLEIEDKIIKKGDGSLDVSPYSTGIVTFFLDKDTIAAIYVFSSNDFGMRAWDVINSIKVT